MVTSIRPGVTSIRLRWTGTALWLAVVALSVGMTLAILWATSVALAWGALDIDVMVRTHGVLNALAVTALVLTASTWTRQGVMA